MGKEKEGDAKGALAEKWRSELDLMPFLKCQFRKIGQTWSRLNVIS